MMSRVSFKVLLLGSAALFLSACATAGPEPVAPVLETPPNFTNAEASLRNEENFDTRPWWQGIEDKTLTQLISNALDQNLDIGIAVANLVQARAGVSAFRSDLSPQFDGFVDSQLQGILADTGDGDVEGSLSAGGVFNYDVDIAGRNRRSLQAAQARFEASAFNLSDIRRLTAASIATQYIELRRAGARLVLLDSSLDIQSRTVEIVQARFDAGLTPALDVDRAAADLARTQAQRGLLHSSRETAGFALSLLAGEFPGSLDLGIPEDDIIPDFTREGQVGVPADLLRRRPDVRTAEKNLIAEIADIGVQEADLYPSLNLPGSIQIGDTTSGSTIGALTTSVGAMIDIPLFDAGRRQAEVKIEQAQAKAALLAYRRSLLGAVSDVESALVQITALNEQKTELIKAVNSSQSAYEQLDALYSEGLASFIDVLDAQRTLISSRESLVDNDANLASTKVSLYTSLGGVPLERTDNQTN